MTLSETDYKRAITKEKMSDSIEVDIVNMVSEHLECFDKHMSVAASCYVPEHPAPTMYRMLENEMYLPAGLRVYLSWKRDHIRLTNTWTWFSPKRIFQMHHENLYIIGQKHEMASAVPSGFVIYDPENRIYIVKYRSKEIHYARLTDVIKELSNR